MPIATTATPAPAALLAAATPLKVACEKLPVVVTLALSAAVALPVGTTMLEPLALASVNIPDDVVARAALCWERTEATPPAEVATGGMPVMMPAELVMVV
jgi:hypothetical protein